MLNLVKQNDIIQINHKDLVIISAEIYPLYIQNLRIVLKIFLNIKQKLQIQWLIMHNLTATVRLFNTVKIKLHIQSEYFHGPFSKNLTCILANAV